MNDDDQFDIGDQSPLDRQNKQPWFGPKAFGVGYGPRTWQGFLVTAGLALVAILVGTLAKGHHHHSSLIWLVLIPVAAIPWIIRLIQRR